MNPAPTVSTDAIAEDAPSQLDRIEAKLDKVILFTDNLSQLLSLIPPEALQLFQMQMAAKFGG